jgi:hypothetical protein
MSKRGVTWSDFLGCLASCDVVVDAVLNAGGSSHAAACPQKPHEGYAGALREIFLHGDTCYPFVLKDLGVFIASCIFPIPIKGIFRQYESSFTPIPSSKNYSVISLSEPSPVMPSLMVEPLKRFIKVEVPSHSIPNTLPGS